jgi:dTDP-4-dehydrorhamnose reductase
MVVAAITQINRQKYVVIGADGMLGYALAGALPGAVLFGRADLDITDPDAVSRTVRQLSPGIVINAAAYTDVDGCEDNYPCADAVNGRGPGYLAEACAECHAILVHYSTDYVFDGSKQEGYREDDIPCPLNRYGKSKLIGERNVMRYHNDYRLIRTSWLFGAHGKNFVDTVLELSERKPSVRIVMDQTGKPTYTKDLAKKTLEVIGMQPGIYHLTNEGQCSWYEFARTFIPNAVPCTTAEFPRQAKRPPNSVLVNTKTTPMRHWRDAVTEYIRNRGNL